MLGIFGKKETEKYVVSSPLKGMLVKDGKPLPNTKITRYLSWTGFEGERTDTFFTDEKGLFLIPAYEEKLRLGTLTQFYGNMLLVAEYKGAEIEIWSSSKFNAEIYSETDGPLNELVCDVDTLEAGIEMKYSTINTKCRWNNTSESNT